jgi:signal transduction histidine kinase
MTAIPLRRETVATRPALAWDSGPADELLAAQNQIIDFMATGAALEDTLRAIALMVERLAPPALCSVLLLQPDGKHLRHGAGPSLPDAYNKAINGLEIGPSVGSCGTAAWRKEPVIVRDLASDPLWEGPREFATSFGLRACWSMPVMDEKGVVLGTIAMYYREPREPGPRDFGLLAPGARLVRLALAQNRKEEELRAAEAQSRLATAAADLGTFDIDLATNRVIWSERFKAMLGAEQSFQPTLDSLSVFIHPAERERFDIGFHRWIGEANSASRSNEFRILRANDGAERIISIQGRVLLNAQGVPRRATGIGVDMTELRLAERQQRDMEERANQIQKLEALGRLAGGIAHDLNNTLMPILGLSKLAMEEISPLDPIGEHLALIHQSGERARDLVSQILTFSRKEEIARAPIDLEALVADSMSLMRASLSAGVELRERAVARPVVWANQGQLDQVLTNLVANAAQAIGSGLGTITVEIAADGRAKSDDPASAKMARLSVIDDGPGIDRGQMQRLFEPFFTTKPVGEGTGLGLAIVHGIVTGHGGRIEVSSQLGQGARFDVYLPLLKTAETPA